MPGQVIEKRTKSSHLNGFDRGHDRDLAGYVIGLGQYHHMALHGPVGLERAIRVIDEQKRSGRLYSFEEECITRRPAE